MTAAAQDPGTARATTTGTTDTPGTAGTTPDPTPTPTRERPAVQTGSIDLAALPTFTPDQWEGGTHELLLLGARITVQAAPGTVDTAHAADDTAWDSAGITATADTEVTVRLDVPLGDAAGYWHPNAGWERTLPADWSPWRPVSLVDSAPVGCLYDTAGRTMLAFAADRTVRQTAVRFGVSEEHKRFGVWLRFPLAAGETVRLRLAAPGASLAAALRDLREWFAALPGGTPMPTPDFGRTPVYSTWYAFAQDVTAAGVEREAALAAELGCGQLFLDDGWQLHGDGRGYAGCGDWTADPVKFPDLRAHVETVRAAGLRYTAWIAPLLLGERAEAHRTWARFAPHYVHRLDCRILDPRHAEVREHVVRVCRDAVADYGLDGLKIDFLDEAVAYGAAPAPEDAGPGFVADVGEAMALLLGLLREELRELRGDEFVIELRQRYTGPAMTAYGNLLRAIDCPADAVANRVRTLDIAMLAPGGAVHSDMLMWDPQGAPEVLARQVHGALHSVPQISARLTELPAPHREALAFWLAAWRRLAPALTGGHYEPGRPDELYPQVTARHGEQWVVTAYDERPVTLPTGPWQALTLVNASTTGRLLLEVEGPARRVRIEPYDAAGRPGPELLLDLAEGLYSVAVPAGGLCDVTEATG
ncbi:glycoside hydrolase family 36 protein [Kitasatospora sp. MBT66]|uniref:glycoside hydrolase family 36 protein n=1 Tax=Kitasatospora sp. MBT66 TaxID=1444769 RepID=UPI00068D0084|nr:glycoside hydrolase family 36 protein [Kitasatospora sp. MBT66]